MKVFALTRNFVLPALICGFMMVLGSGQLMAQPDEPDDGTSTDQQDAYSRMDLADCGSAMPVVPQQLRKRFKQTRAKDTMHGIWRGRVSGEYESQFMADDGFLNVDYYMIVDMGSGEALTLEQFSEKRAAPPVPPGAPTWSFLMCGGQYLPPAPPQIHEFHKVSNNIEEGRRMLEESTGMKFSAEALDSSQTFLSGAWKKLVDTKYFDNSLYPAYAGGFYKPFKVDNTVNDSGQRVLEISFESEYRGGGATAAEFKEGEPIVGYERGQFVGVNTNQGDFLLSSIGNDLEEWFKAAVEGGLLQVFMEKSVIGPLAREIFMISNISYDEASDQISMAWDSSGGTKYTVERSSDLVTWAEVGSVVGENNVTSFVDTSLPTDKETLYYRVRR